jgi:RHH-type proline utilization regulon transcriptional repressor/proline dehydrogenase/delta 1-pyrroline-5-carboxylate dehydrogenase
VTSAPILRRAADALEAELPRFCALLVKEAHKTWGDAVSEVREAVDFLRYYADEAERIMQPRIMPGLPRAMALLGVTGESNSCADRARPLGLHQPVELPAGHLHRPGGRRPGHRQHRAGQTRRANPGVALEAVKLLHAPVCLPTPCNCCTARAKPWARRW